MSRLRDLRTRLQQLLHVRVRIRGQERARDIAFRAFLVLFTTLFALQILIPWWDVWQDEPSVVARLSVTALAFTFIAAYGATIFRLYFLRRSWVEIFTQRERWVLRGIIGGTAATLVWWQGEDWAVSLIFVVIVTILTAPPLQAFASGAWALACVLMVLVSADISDATLISTMGFSFVFGVLIASQMRQGGKIGDLMEARYLERRMAAAEERLRITQELHDVLGHTLSLITLKSELARALVERNPDGAMREMREVETLARSAMTDVRRTVAAERQPLLGSELADARHLLDAAGITLEITGRHDRLPDEVAALFAWGVREGVTNVVRHSRAQRCTISFIDNGGHTVLSVVDDGAGAGTNAPGAPPGSGLTGLNERAERQGGTLVFSTRGKSGHSLTLSVPTPSGV